MGSRGWPCLVVAWRTFWTTSGKGQRSSSRFAPACSWSAELLLTGLIQWELPAGRTEVGTALEPGVRGLQLAIRGEEFARDQAKVPEEAHKDGQGRLDGLGAHAAAEVAQIVLARNGLVQPGQLARAAALLLLA